MSEGKVSEQSSTPESSHTKEAAHTSSNARHGTKQVPDNMEKMCSGLGEAAVEQKEDLQELIEQIGTNVSDYCRKRPLMATLTVFTMGFYVGWKVKPW